jgi:hypothetical protein
MRALHKLAGVFLLLAVVTGCNVSVSIETAVPEATETLAVTAVPKPTSTPPPASPASTLPAIPLAETPAREPTALSQPNPTAASACDANQVLKKLKAEVAYEQFVLTYNIVKGDSYLAIWFVDPTLDPSAGLDAVHSYSDLAFRQAAVTAAWLNVAEPCVGGLFTEINPIVVDRNYNGWFSGDIATSTLPTTAQLSDQQVQQIRDGFKVMFLRDKPAASDKPAPAGSCGWPEAARNLQRHFASTRENVGFFFVQDDIGVNVWAQWDGSTDPVLLSASMANVTMELHCLFPPPNNIFVQVVDDAGNLNLLGLDSGFKTAAEQFKILYP